MSYLLIGNISALICDDCIEPLANARIRVYLPEPKYPSDNLTVVKGIFNNLRPLSAREVLMKADRLLAEAALDEKGNFSLAWEETHLFTEPLELDLCLDKMPGNTGSYQPRNYHLSYMVPHWKRNKENFIGAYAYVIPAAIWTDICSNAGAWVITGFVKRYGCDNGQPQLKVAAFNAANGKMVGQATTNEFGRYTIRFSRKDLYAGTLQPLREGRKHFGPDVYFKIYRHDQLIWAEDESIAASAARQDLAPCACLDICYKPSAIGRASIHINRWINNIVTLTDTRKRTRVVLKHTTNPQLVVKDYPHV
ncbi:hypothetical protein [Chitinophaga vietnamensis]|uniref:hypothetical protein n=1 Tax=Chitinophaga vietnamensis TaxID=2593957 RepID=UPI0011788274|nr:hypothetical protein [Chitinophaga vietnamensis]